MIQHLQGWRILWAAAAAVAIGCLLLLIAGAPPRMPVMNLAALLIGLSALAIASAVQRAGAARDFTDWVLVAAGSAVPLTALFGAATDGISRWVVIGSVTTQPALIVVPPLAIAFARHPSSRRAMAVALAAIGVALQPDAAAAAMLAFGIVLPLLVKRFNAVQATAAATAILAFAAAVLADPQLPPAPFVEGVLFTYLQQGPLAAALSIAGLTLLFVPVLTAAAAGRRSSAAAFGGVWAGAVLASLLGNYPAPLLGYGGSFVLGYVLSLGVAHGLTSRRARAPGSQPRPTAEQPEDARLELA